MPMRPRSSMISAMRRWPAIETQTRSPTRKINGLGFELDFFVPILMLLPRVYAQYCTELHPDDGVQINRNGVNCGAPPTYVLQPYRGTAVQIRVGKLLMGDRVPPDVDL